MARARPTPEIDRRFGGVATAAARVVALIDAHAARSQPPPSRAVVELTRRPEYRRLVAELAAWSAFDRSREREVDGQKSVVRRERRR